MTGIAKFAFRLIATASAALLSCGIATAEEPPIDPLTGMAIPLLPGEKVARFANGCGLILTANDGYYDNPQQQYGKSYWAGACRFGLVDGFGFILSKDDKGRWAPIEPNLYRTSKLPAEAYPYLGRSLPFSERDTVSFREPSDPKKGGFVSVERAIPEDKIGGPFGISQGAVRRRVAKYESTIVAIGNLQANSEDSFVLNVAKLPCRTDGTVSGSRVVIKVSKNPLYYAVGDGPPPRAAAAIEKQIRPFCEAAIKRRLSDGTDYKYWEPFKDADYGYYFVVYLERKSTVVSADGKTTYPETTLEIELCPLDQGLDGCDPIWHRMQKPFIDRMDEMRAQNAAVRAARIAELDRLYEPLRQAARAKAKEIAAR